MTATIVTRSETSFTVQVEIPYHSSMLDFEQAILDRLNLAGVVATEEALHQFDTDGSPITVGAVKFTSKGQLPKEYQTPYGVATVARHVYQSPQGGKTYCPLDRDARIVTSSTPRFAKMIAHKYAEFGSGRVILDLEENHGRKGARSFVQNVADAVATVALAQEESWDYALPEMEHPITTITVGLDGTCLLMCEDGWRETMVGTIGFYDQAGERQHTISMAATPEYGKATFLGGWTGKWSGSRSCTPRRVTWGSPTGRAGTGISSSRGRRSRSSISTMPPSTCPMRRTCSLRASRRRRSSGWRIVAIS